jgi:hypothetical protein
MRVATALLAPPDRLLHFLLQLSNILLSSISSLLYCIRTVSLFGYFVSFASAVATSEQG